MQGDEKFYRYLSLSTRAYTICCVKLLSGTKAARGNNVDGIIRSLATISEHASCCGLAVHNLSAATQRTATLK